MSPVPRAAMRAVGVAVTLAALLAPAPRAGATVFTRLDFETPGYGCAPRQLRDHCLLKSAGQWHLFYTELPTSVSANHIGHAVSTDLVHWTEHADVLVPGAYAWLDHQVWAPAVIALPGGGWRMFFTGQSMTGAQTIGSASSPDLETWTLDSPNPCYVPPPGWVRWGPDFSCDCRDPYVYFEGDHWSMLYTCSTDALPHRPALGKAVSTDLLGWSDAGPVLIDSISVSPTSLESPSLFLANGRAELHFTRYQTEMVTAPTLAGPFDLSATVAVDPRGSADEWVNDGNVQLMSRVRQYGCVPGTSVLVIDTVTATPTGYAVPAAPGMPAGWTCDGDAFVDQPTYGDGPALRGDPPAAPEGVRWLGTGETCRMPGWDTPCSAPTLGQRTGTALSPAFQLQGDLLAFRLMGKAPPDSAYASLIDDCTGLELVRQVAPGTSALTPFAWSNTGRRGWRVRLKLTDRSTATDGEVGLDAVADSSTGSPAPPSLPLVHVTAPAGGENLTPGTLYTIRWTGSATAGIDSFVVYVSYDSFATPPTRLARRNASQFTFSWTVPAGPKFDARIRVVIYAKNAVHACDQSPSFLIGVVTGVAPGFPGAAGVRLSVIGQPGPRPVLLWSADAPGPWTLALYDVRGRRVRTLLERAPGGEGRAPWDGRLDDGRAAPPGLYFARLAHGAVGASAVVVRTGR